MSATTSKPALEALRRLLTNAQEAGGEAKVDALVALSQRTLFVATWAPAHEGFRTLENGRGESALPVFTGADLFPDARARFGWPEGTQLREVGARQAFRYVGESSLDFLLVDVGTAHTLSASPEQLAPLLTANQRALSGPFASVGKTSSQILQAVRQSEPPMALRTEPPVVSPPSIPALRNSSIPTPPPEGEMPVFEPLEAPPSEEIVEALVDALSGYLEVEWAVYCHASPLAAGLAPRPTAALRLDTYRSRLPEITASLVSGAKGLGLELEVILADGPELVRAVREHGVVFYPWTDKARR